MLNEIVKLKVFRVCDPSIENRLQIRSLYDRRYEGAK